MPLTLFLADTDLSMLIIISQTPDKVYLYKSTKSMFVIKQCTDQLLALFNLQVKYQMSEHNTQQKTHKLTTSNLFNHFFLLHDFLFKFTRNKAKNSSELDAQIDISATMNRATAVGTKFGYISSLGGLLLYCLKTRNIPMKFFAGFLWVYWFNHFGTLGSYCGAMLSIPTAYTRVSQYYDKHQQSPSPMDKLEEFIKSSIQYQDTHDILRKIFPQRYTETTESFTNNEFFVKNKQKYNLGQYSKKQSLKLAYCDNFLTRYIYYSFSRWLLRVKLYIGLEAE